MHDNQIRMSQGTRDSQYSILEMLPRVIVQLPNKFVLLIRRLLSAITKRTPSALALRQDTKRLYSQFLSELRQILRALQQTLLNERALPHAKSGRD